MSTSDPSPAGAGGPNADDTPVGRPVEAVVDGFTHGGEGVARVDGKAVFVPGTLPGERVRLVVVDDRRRWARARLLEVLEASPDRVAPPCPYVGRCGGCDLQHVRPEAQLELKARVVAEQLARLGGLPEPPVAACLGLPDATGYRAQARLRAAPDGRLGFHRAGSSEVVPIDRCLVLTDEAQRARELVGDDTGAEQVTVRALGPDRPTAVLRAGPGPLQPPAGDVDVVLEQPDGSHTALRGDGTEHVRIEGLDLTVPSSAFFQSGPAAASLLVGTVLEAVGGIQGTLTWDLYAGVGLLSLPLARAGAQVVAVEGDAVAAEAARTNARSNALELTVLDEPVAHTLARARRGELELPEVVVLDPPRVGAGRDVVEGLVATEPAAIVYVACDVAALARDARSLIDAGYTLDRARPLDLFPMTHHVEVVASFSR